MTLEQTSDVDVAKAKAYLAIHDRFVKAATVPSDINEHIPTLLAYAIRPGVERIAELGVRSCVSSAAFAEAALMKPSPDRFWVQVDPEKWIKTVDQLHFDCAKADIAVTFREESDLTCELSDVDLLFIDTWHVYGQMKRELSRWHDRVSSYIIMHDTTVDAVHGETVRCGSNGVLESQTSGIPLDEILKGIWPAITEFLMEHPEWTLERRDVNNHGLTVLARVAKSDPNPSVDVMETTISGTLNNPIVLQS